MTKDVGHEYSQYDVMKLKLHLYRLPPKTYNPSLTMRWRNQANCNRGTSTKYLINTPPDTVKVNKYKDHLRNLGESHGPWKAAPKVSLQMVCLHGGARPIRATCRRAWAGTGPYEKPVSSHHSMCLISPPTSRSGMDETRWVSFIGCCSFNTSS